MRRLRTTAAAALLAVLAAVSLSANGQGLLSGKFALPTLGPVANGTLTLALSQEATSGGGNYLAPSPVSCYTSTDGSIVGVPNPQVVPTGAAFTGTGTLAAGTYYAAIAYTTASPSGPSTLPSPAGSFGLTSLGEIQINAPAVQPAGATGFAVYIGTSPGTLTLQGTVTGWTAYMQSAPLVSGAAAPGSNTSLCSVLFNDQILPTGTWYTATLEDDNGNVLPGFPRNWYLEGAGVTVETLQALASSPAVLFPQPLLANPANPIVGQSLSGTLGMNYYPLRQSGNVGPGFYGAFWTGAAPAAGSTLAVWTPNTAVALQRVDANAQTAGAGGSNGITITVSDGTTTCSFAGLLIGAATSSSAVPTSGPNTCTFRAGIALTVKLAADDHTSEPSNLNVGFELTVN
ncbi:MAG: hypothetical protein ACRD1C_03875 [Terriglobales bacterium]